MLRYAAVALSVVVVSSGLAQAGDSLKDERGEAYRSERFSADISIGVMKGKSNEYVYNPDGSLLSQLIWKFDNNVVLNGGLSWTPFHALTLGVRGRTKLSDQSTMDDFDFPGSVCGIPGPFCQSHHEETDLKTATSLDVYAGYAFYKSRNLSVSALAGYKWDHFAWDGRGGTSNYAPPFPNVSVIAYDQWWEAPYLGLQAAGRWDRLSLQGRVIGSMWASGHDRDDHKLRGLLFTEDFKRSDMVSVNAKVGYEVIDHVTLTLGYDYDRWLTAKGPTVMTDYVNGGTTVFSGDAAGADSHSHAITAGVKITH